MRTSSRRGSAVVQYMGAKKAREGRGADLSHFPKSSDARHQRVRHVNRDDDLKRDGDPWVNGEARLERDSPHIQHASTVYRIEALGNVSAKARLACRLVGSMAGHLDISWVIFLG